MPPHAGAARSEIGFADLLAREKRTMRIALVLALVSSLVGTAAGQETPKEPSAPVHLKTLTIQATDLPAANWTAVTSSLEGGTYPLSELQQRIEQKLRDNGYYFAHVDTPRLENGHREGAAESADVSVSIQAGNQFHTGEITFRGIKAFPKEKLRGLFVIQAGSVFNPTAIGAGLDKLKSLYEADGFADVGAVPSIAVDDAKHIIDVSVEVEEGQPYLFGPLTLEGNEPSPGANKGLLAAWKQLEGKRYNPDLLKKWLAANAPKVAAGAPPIHPHAEGVADPDAHLMDVRLNFE
jgi:Surface antigen variable number repeat